MAKVLCVSFHLPLSIPEWTDSEVTRNKQHGALNLLTTLPIIAYCAVGHCAGVIIAGPEIA